MANNYLGYVNRPTTRDEFAEYCLRRLGKPVIEINVDGDEVNDRINDALSYFADYHFDATETIFYRHIITPFNRQGAIYQITVNSGGTLYANGEPIVFTRHGAGGKEAAADVVTDENGVITAVNVTVAGDHYIIPPDISVNTVSGSGANLSPILGGFVPVPDNIIGAVEIFPIGGLAISTNDIFNIRYQIALNDLYTLTSQSMVPYYMAMQHISVLEELLVGKIPFRFVRHRNRIELDADWSKFADGNILVVKAYQVVDPNEFKDVWSDRWLQRYATAQIKRQWGENLKKFGGMQLPGGVIFNGQSIWNEAVAEIAQLEQEMITSFSIPPDFYVG